MLHEACSAGSAGSMVRRAQASRGHAIHPPPLPASHAYASIPSSGYGRTYFSHAGSRDSQPPPPAPRAAGPYPAYPPGETISRRRSGVMPALKHKLAALEREKAAQVQAASMAASRFLAGGAQSIMDAVAAR